MGAELGVNVDHVATVRQARGVNYPDPLRAALAAEEAGADQITVHLRMDRRHIQDQDLERLNSAVRTRLNVEMAATDEMMAIALSLRPHQVTLVPEREGEITTEGGLDLRDAGTLAAVTRAVSALREAGIRAAIFADPDPDQVQAVVQSGATVIELNTAAYAEAGSEQTISLELQRVEIAAEHAHAAGLYVAAGHGLHFENVQPLTRCGLIQEYNIGHALVAEAIFDGLASVVREMKVLIS